MTNTWFRRLWPFGLALLTFGVGFYMGVRRRAPSEAGDQAVKLALDKNSDSLRAVHAREDSLKRIDSTVSATTVAARDSVAVHRPAVARAAVSVSVSTTPTDSSVRVQRPAAGDSVPPGTRDTTLILPLEIATFIRQAKPQLVRDSIALHADTVLLIVKDARIATLEEDKRLLVDRDSVHVDNEKRLMDERDSAFRRGAIKGAKVTVEVLAATISIVKIVALARH